MGELFSLTTYDRKADLSRAAAVARIDNLEFLADVIPKTTTYRQFKERKARDEAEAAAAAAAAQSGQTTLQNGVNGQLGVHAGESAAKHAATGSSRFDESFDRQPTTIVNGSPIADRTVSSTPHAHPGTGDVEMQG